MHRSFMRRTGSAALALAAGVVALTSTLASPASAADELDTVDAARSTVKIHKTSGLFGSGAVMIVDLDVTCPGGAVESYIFVNVSQAGGSFGTVYAEGATSVTCTGDTGTISVPVLGYAPFRAAPAFATAGLQVCDEDFNCTTSEHAREIKLADGAEEVRSYRSDDLKYRLPRTADILAAGAGAIVHVPYTCAAGLYGSFEAVLGQATDSFSTTTAFDTSEMRCTASSRTGVLAFHAQGIGWQPGAAFVAVDGYTCPAHAGCSRGTTYRSIKLG